MARKKTILLTTGEETEIINFTNKELLACHEECFQHLYRSVDLSYPYRIVLKLGRLKDGV